MQMNESNKSIKKKTAGNSLNKPTILREKVANEIQVTRWFDKMSQSKLAEKRSIPASRNFVDKYLPVYMQHQHLFLKKR